MMPCGLHPGGILLRENGQPYEGTYAMTMSCVTRNGGSDCVGASAFRDGTFWKSCAIKNEDIEVKGDRR